MTSSVRSAQANTTTRVDNGFERTAILLNKGASTSLDVLSEDGSLFCRINITEFEAGNDGCVDIIISDNQSARMTAYANGNRTQHPMVEGSKVHAIAISPK